MEEKNWFINEFRELTKIHFSTNDLIDVDSTLLSITWKVNMCKFHIEEYQKVMNRTANVNVPPIVDVVGKILKRSTDSETMKEFWESIFISEAHIIAYAQSLHSLADIYAHLIVCVMDLRSKFKNPKHISLLSVYKVISNQNNAKVIVEKIEHLQQSIEFKYLNAFVNTTKHRSLVPVNYSVNFNEENFGLKFKEFKYDQNEFLSKWANEFTGIEFKKTLGMFIEIGIEMNEYLKRFSG